MQPVCQCIIVLVYVVRINGYTIVYNIHMQNQKN